MSLLIGSNLILDFLSKVKNDVRMQYTYVNKRRMKIGREDGKERDRDGSFFIPTPILLQLR